MAEYGSMLSVSLLASILFLGGWHGPLPVTQWLGLVPDNGALAGYLGKLFGLINLLGKGLLGVTVMMWVRWTLPRLRIDQVMVTCLKYCTPIAAAMFLGAAVWQYKLPATSFFGLRAASPHVFALSEGWSAPAPTAPAPEEKPPADEAANRAKTVDAVRPLPLRLAESRPATQGGR